MIFLIRYRADPAQRKIQSAFLWRDDKTDKTGPGQLEHPVLQSRRLSFLVSFLWFYENLNSTLTKITDNIEIFNYALSNTEGITKLKIPNRGNSLFDKNYEELFKLGAATIHEENDIIDYESFDVKKTLLDKIIPSSEKIGFIKIDVEGHESEVIKGSIDTIKRDKPILLIEIEEKHTKKPIKDTINFVKNIGYDCYQLHNREISKFEIKKHNIKDNNFIFLPN